MRSVALLCALIAFASWSNDACGYGFRFPATPPYLSRRSRDRAQPPCAFVLGILPRRSTTAAPPTSALHASPPPVQKTDEEWRSTLTPEAYDVLRNEGTEPPNTSPLNDVKEDGTFKCAGCGAPLFRTAHKFDSGTGWPSFFRPIDGDVIDLSTDYKLVLPRTECRCANCGGHLGHVFQDGPEPTGQRYCMNGVAMSFTADAEAEDSNTLAELKAREENAVLPKPGPATLLPTVVVYVGLVVAYGNSFWTNYETAKDAGLPLPQGPLENFPLVMAVVCAGFAAREVKKMI